MRHDTHDHTFVPANPTTIADRLPGHLDLGGVHLHLDDDAPGADETAEGWLAPVTWRRGRQHGTGALEVRRAAHGWSELALRWDHPVPVRQRARRVPADTPAVALERAVTGRPRPTGPPRRRPGGRRRAALTTSTVTAVALVAALVVVDPFSPTAVTTDDALARFRAEVAAAQEADAQEADAQEADAQARTVAEETSHGAASAQDPGPTATTDAGPQETSEASTTAETATTAPDQGTATASAPTVDAPSGTSDADARAATSSQPAGPTRPAEGVYRYATDGYEELDARGSHRRFPQQTVQTVHHTSDGYRHLWEPIEERRDEYVLSTANDPHVLVTTATSRSFFGQQRDQRFTCTPSDVGPRGWVARCEDGTGGTRMTVTTRVEGTERRTVRGADVEVVRLHVVAELTGETEGRRTSTTWTRVGDGLLVATEVDGEVEADGPFGRVRYRESYTLDLLDPEPAR
jgi:hypothetical protein